MKLKKAISNQKGQTSVEYILLVASVTIIILSVLNIVQEKLVGTGNCPADTVYCAVERFVRGPQFEGTFRNFSLRR